MEEKVPENDEIVRACRTTIKHFDPLLWFIKNPNSGENKWTSRKVMKEFMQNTQYHQYTSRIAGMDEMTGKTHSSSKMFLI